MDGRKCALKGRVMFFMIRSLFWLGLVFMALPWDGESLRADLADATQKGTHALARQAQALCVKDPIGCAAQAITLGQTFDPASVQDAPRDHSQDTLQPGDRTPGWRGPATLAARR
ncbi:MAG: hypothetical protein JWN07_2718 [Hyphomicrobiales bacterium]|nr:hypothetical protein [Hyphomicrobiales bacterium]